MQLAIDFTAPAPEPHESCHVLGRHVCDDLWDCTAFDELDWMEARAAHSFWRRIWA